MKTTDTAWTCSSNGRSLITKPGIGMKSSRVQQKSARPQRMWNADITELMRERACLRKMKKSREIDTCGEESLKERTFEEEKDGCGSQPMKITNMAMEEIYSITSDIFQVVQLVTITFHPIQYTSNIAQLCIYTYLLTDHTFNIIHWILN